MKKLVLSLLSLTFIGLSQFASADELLAWAEMSRGSYVAPGCAWQANGSSSQGPNYALICNGAYAGARTGNRPAPEIVTANTSAGYYVVPHSGGSAPINGYNYAIYKGYVAPVCKAPWTKTYDTLQQASTARGYADYYKMCDSSCRLDIVSSGTNYSKYDLTCH